MSGIFDLDYYYIVILVIALVIIGYPLKLLLNWLQDRRVTQERQERKYNSKSPQIRHVNRQSTPPDVEWERSLDRRTDPPLAVKTARGENEGSQGQLENTELLSVLTDIRSSLDTLSSQVNTIQKILASFSRYNSDERHSLSISRRNDSNLDIGNTSPISRMCHLYKAARENPDLQQEFINQYKPFRLYNALYMRMMLSDNVEPVFEMQETGDFLAAQLEEDEQYYIFPNFDLIIQSENFISLAIGKVFSCKKYTPGNKYREYWVTTPATFYRKDGKTWGLIKPGTLEFGRAE